MAEIIVGDVDDIPEGCSKVVRAGAREIAVFNKDGEFFAMDNVCPHRGAPLNDGRLNGKTISCPLHDWEFDITTGESSISPSIKLNTYGVEVRGNEVILLV